MNGQELRDLEKVEKAIDDFHVEFTTFKDLILSTMVPRKEVDKRFDDASKSRNTLFWKFLTLIIGIMTAGLGVVYFIAGAIK